LGNGEFMKGFRGRSERGRLVTPPIPRSLSADSNRPRQRRRGLVLVGRGGGLLLGVVWRQSLSNPEPKARAVRLLHTLLLLEDDRIPLPYRRQAL